MNNKELLKKIEVLQAENEQLKTEIEQYKITSKTVEETLDRDVVNFSNPHGKINSENLANPPANTINKLHETVGNQAPPDVTGKNQIPGIELLQSEAKYKNLVENSLDGIIIVRDNKILFANDTFCKLTESACEKILNEPALNFIHPNDREKMVLIAEKRKNGDRSTMNETIRLMGKNGEYIDCDSFFSIIEFEGKPASFITLHNITETKRMQLALIESEKKYRDLSEMLPQSIYELDLKGNITYLNQTGLDTFGITRADYGISAFTFIVPSDHEKMKANMQRSILENHSSHGNKYTAVRKNGETFPVMIFAGPITENAKVVGTRGIILDMTEHEAMEKALRESEEKYRTLIDKALDGIIITQLGYFKFVNPAFCEMMLYSAEELINKPYLEFVDKEDHDMLINFHKRRMAGEEFHVMSRSRLIRKDGKTLQVELNIRTTEMDGQPSAFIIIRNITDRLQTEEELRIAKQKLEMLNQNLEIRIRESSLKLTEANTQLIRLQKENLQSQFEVLRQQVNPHFLFNSLNVLTSLIKLEPDLAEKFTEHLSKVYRYVLENKDNDLVKLHTELDFLDAYIFLLNIRFMDKIKVKVNIHDDKKELLILPLALQLLIENAIKHNSMSKKNPLVIEISVEKNHILKIENNLQERESHMVSTGVGLKNIEHRYHLLEMPAPEFIKTKTKFIARIPLKN